MPKTKTWFLKLENGFIFMYKGDERSSSSECLGGKVSDLGPVLEARNHDDAQVKFKFKHGEPRARSLKDLGWEKSPFSRKFKNAHAGSDFMAIWEKDVAPNLNAITGAFNKDPDAVAIADTDIALPKAKRPKEDKGTGKLDREIDAAYLGCFEVSVSCLIEPTKANTLRDPDPVFIASLKKEMIENPTTLVSPIVGLVRLRPGQKFDNKHPNSYKYETVGGNNSRIALQELTKMYPDNINYQVRLVAVYGDLTEDLVLRLAARHNRATDFTHSMKTQDKVATCRRRYDSSSSKQEWRRLCSEILSQSVSQLDDAMIFFLASLPEEEHTIIKEIFDLFESCEIKDQKLSRSQRRQIVNSKLDCKGVNFKPLRGVVPSTRKELLTKVRNGELSFSELNQSCKYVKKMADVQTQFMRYLNVSTWEQAEEMCPEYTKKEKLQPFLDMNFKDDSIPPVFLAFCKQAKCSTLSSVEDTSGDDPSEGNLFLQAGKSAAIILKYDVLQLGDKDLLSSTSIHSCTGFSLTIVDPPSEWSTTDILVISRLVRSVNAAFGLQTYSIAFITAPDDIITSLQQDFKTQVVYYNNKAVVNKDSLSTSVFPIVLCHWTTSSGNVGCYPKQSTFVGNLLNVEVSSNQPYEDRAKPKPEVYSALINLLSLHGQWILDPLSGNGSVSVSALHCGRNCVACEPNDEYCGIIHRNILQAKEKLEDN